MRIQPKPGQWRSNVDGNAIGKPDPSSEDGTIKDEKGVLLFAFFVPPNAGASDRAEIWQMQMA